MESRKLRNKFFLEQPLLWFETNLHYNWKGSNWSFIFHSIHKSLSFVMKHITMCGSWSGRKHNLLRDCSSHVRTNYYMSKQSSSFIPHQHIPSSPFLSWYHHANHWLLTSKDTQFILHFILYAYRSHYLFSNSKLPNHNSKWMLFLSLNLRAYAIYCIYIGLKRFRVFIC